MYKNIKKFNYKKCSKCRVLQIEFPHIKEFIVCYICYKLSYNLYNKKNLIN